MAFNPFEAFSVRSKLGRSVMAVLGIVVMLTFVLSTGMMGQGNDFFDQLGSMFSSKGQGQVVAVGYGDDIRESELAEVRRQRLAANSFLTAAVDASYTNWALDLKNQLETGSSRLSSETKREIERFVNLRANLSQDPRAYGNFLNDFQRFGPEMQRFRQAISSSRLLPENSEDRKALDAVAAIILHDLGQTLFFLVELGETDQDLLDFILLLKKADKLGINYSPDGIRELVARDTSGRLKKSDNGEIEKRMRASTRFGEFTGDWLVQAVGNEYRARAALAVLQGTSSAALNARARRAQSLPAILLGIDASSLPLPGELPTASALAGGLTPHEFWEFYKDRCTENTYAVIEVPADAFINDVKEEPTPKERVEFFNKYRGDLHDPARDRPGFKEPRKVKVEFIALDATATRITQAIPKIQAASLFLCASAGAIGGNPAMAIATASQPALAETLPIREGIAKKMDANLERYTPLETYYFTPRDTSIFRPRSIVSALAMLAGNPDIATFVAAAATVHQNVEVIDHHQRIPFLLQAFLTPFNPTMGNALGMPAFAYALNPKLPPEALYRGEVVAALKKQQRQSLFQTDVREFQTKLSELTKDADPFQPKPDKVKAEKALVEGKKFLAEWLKDRGLTVAGTKTAEDQYALASDPDLKPLNSLAIVEPDGTNSLTKQIYEAIDPRFSSGGVTKYYVSPLKPFWFPAAPVGDASDKPTHFVWLSEDLPAVAYNSLDNANKLSNGEMTKRVDRAWKLEKARALAKAAADALADDIRKISSTVATDPGGVEKQLKDLVEPKKYRRFELDRLANLKFQHQATQANVSYETPKIEKNQVLYPTPNFVEQLLEMRSQPLGSVMVLSDAPRAKFYVACTVSRHEKTIEQFRDVFTHANSSGPGLNPLFAQHALPEEQRNAVREVLPRLRAEAKLDEKESFKKRDSRDE